MNLTLLCKNPWLDHKNGEFMFFIIFENHWNELLKEIDLKDQEKLKKSHNIDGEIPQY